MAAYMGILAVAKDKDTPVPEKLKLVKFAWAKQEVVIPHKHQEILDFVCGLIVNKKKNGLKEEDEVLVWQSLLAFLTASQSSFSVKSTISKAVTKAINNYINHESDREKKDWKRLSVVLGCGSLLMSIPSIQSSSFSDKCQQLSSLLQLCLIDRKNLGKAQAFVKSIVTVLAHQQSLYHDQKEVISSISDLLPMFVKYQASHADANLQRFVLTSLFHRNHGDVHASFIRHRSGDSRKQSQVPDTAKHMEIVYSGLFNEPNEYLVTTFWPAFVTEFLKQNRSDSKLCFSILNYAVQLLQAGGVANQHVALSSLAQCFQACVAVGCDLSANEKGQDLASWFQQVLEFVLPHHHDRAWYGFMSAVLALRPSLIDRCLTRVLTGALTQVDGEDKDVKFGRDDFLSEVVTVFLKLRRVPYLNECLIKITWTGNPVPITCPSLKKFKEKLNTMFNEVPIISVTNMWTDIKKKLELTVLEQKTGTGKQKSIKQAWLLFLLNSLMSHTQFFDQRSMGMVEEKLHSLLEMTEHNVLKPLAKEYNTAKDEMPMLLDVLVTWAHVRMLLYPRWREQAGIATPQSQSVKAGDIDDKGTKKLMKKVSLPTKVKLIMQRRQVLTSGDKNKEDDYKKSCEEVNELVAELLESLTHGEDDKTDNDWLALFQEFTEIFPLVGHCLTNKLIKSCAQFIVDAVRNGAERSGVAGDECNGGSNSSTLFVEIERFLQHPATMEHRQLQTHLTCLIWKRLLTPKSDESPKKKKKKTTLSAGEETDVKPVSRMFQFITNVKMESVDFSVNPDEIADTLMISGQINPDLIRLLSYLSLEFLPVLCLKSQLGLLSLAACLPATTATLKAKVTCLVEERLIQCLAGRDLGPFFSCVSPDKFLQFSLSLCLEPYNFSRRYLECSTAVVMSKHNQSAILCIKSVVQQMAESMNPKVEISSIEKRLQAAKALIHQFGECKSIIFQVKGAAIAAKEVFFILTDNIFRNVSHWMTDSVVLPLDKRQKQEDEEKKKKKQSGKPLLKAGKKRKLETTEDEVLEDGKSGQEKETGKVSFDLFCLTVECVAEIMMAWSYSNHSVMTHRLAKTVDIVHRSLKRCEANNAGGPFSDQITLLRLNFIQALCKCQKKLASKSSSSSSSSSNNNNNNDNYDEDSSKTTTSTSTDRATQPPPRPPLDLFPLFNKQGISDFWQNIFSLATSEFSSLVSSLSENERPNLKGANCVVSSTFPTMTEITSNADERVKILPRQRGGGRTKSSFSDIEIDNDVDADNKDSEKMKKMFEVEDPRTWSKELYLCVEILKELAVIGGIHDRKEEEKLAVIAATPDKKKKKKKSGSTPAGGAGQDPVFVKLLGYLMDHLNCPSKADLPSVIISLAVWRKLSKSWFTTTHHASQMRDQIFQVLAHSSKLLQHLNYQRTTSSTSSTKAESSTGSIEEAEKIDLKASVCRYIVCSQVHFIQFAKDTNQPELTTVCLQIAPILSLASPADIRALNWVVNTFLFNHPRSATSAISSVMALVSTIVIIYPLDNMSQVQIKLVCACVRLGYQSRLSGKGPEELEGLVQCSKQVSRVLTSLTEGVLKEEVCKFGHTVLSDYVMELQNGALHPKVKKELLGGLYQLLSVCGQNYLAALNAALPSEVKETFKFMHQDYEKFYKYRRTV